MKMPAWFGKALNDARNEDALNALKAAGYTKGPFEDAGALFAIRQISTGRYLLDDGKGTKSEPAAWVPLLAGPRTYGSLGSARKALAAWLKGVWANVPAYQSGPDGEWDGGYLDAKPVPGRDAADMEIVEFRLVEVEVHGHGGTPRPAKRKGNHGQAA